MLAVVCLAVAALAASPAMARTSHSALLTTVKVTISKTNEFKFNLSTSTVKRGIVVFKITNGGLLPHDFKMCSKKSSSATANTCTGRGTAQINPGASSTLRVTILLKGTYEYLCTFPGHAQQGMKGLLKVT
jgi:uncharacterized cupredoxin-like copper-binding protein